MGRSVNLLIKYCFLNILLFLVGGCVNRNLAVLVQEGPQSTIKIYQRKIPTATCSNVGPEISTNQSSPTLVNGSITVVFIPVNAPNNLIVDFNLNPQDQPSMSNAIKLCTDVLVPFCCDFDTRQFPNGLYTLSILARNVIYSTPSITLNIQNAPVLNAPVINPITPNTVTSGSNVSVSGTADPNIIVNVYRNDNDQLLATTTSSTTGTWTANFAAPIPQATYTIYAVATNNIVISPKSNLQSFVVSNA